MRSTRNRSTGFFLVGSYRFVPERQEWIGMVCKQEGTDMAVLTLGAEGSEFAIMQWVKDTIALMRESGELNVQAPDMYDRAAMVAPN
jgi:hypothetical protein